MQRLRSYSREYGIDVVIALAVAVSTLEAALGDASLESGTPDWFAAVAIPLMAAPLLWRRRFPFAAPAGVWAIGVAVSFVDGRLVVSSVGAFAAGFFAAFLLGQLEDERRGRIGLGVVVAGLMVLVLNDPTSADTDVVSVPLQFALIWVAGFVLRERSARAQAAEERAAFAEREREAAARIAVAEERGRIAREMHDVVAHAVSVMVLQVGAVRHRLPAGLDDDREALTAVERTGRSALTEMRQLLGAMRDAGDGVELAPQRGLGGVEELVGEVRRAGLPVRLQVDGDPVALPLALDLSAYRIVQEGLTNALKHARAGQAEVVLRYEPRDLRIEVRDDGAGAAPGDGLGHGLAGVRERVKIHGGEMSAGERSAGGFVLRARLPLPGAQQ